MNAEIKKWRGTPPTTCDLCHQPFTVFFIDCKTRYGPWGLLCSECHTSKGCGLGTGRGQKYRTSDGVKVAG